MAPRGKRARTSHDGECMVIASWEPAAVESDGIAGYIFGKPGFTLFYGQNYSRTVTFMFYDEGQFSAWYLGVTALLRETHRRLGVQLGWSLLLAPS